MSEIGRIPEGVMNRVVFTGRQEFCGVSDGRHMMAFEMSDGTWSWLGFKHPSLKAARAAAKKAGF